MATDIIRPNSNHNELWTTFDYTNINNVVTQPSTSPTTGSVLQNRLDDHLEQAWGFEDVPFATITQVTVWAYHEFEEEEGLESNNIFTKANIGGSEVTMPNLVTGVGATVWDSSTTTGSWVTSDFDSFYVSLNAGSLGNPDSYTVRALYVELTGEGEAGGGEEGSSDSSKSIKTILLGNPF